MTFTTIENDRFADDEYDEESVKSESSVRKMSVFKGQRSQNRHLPSAINSFSFDK